MLGVLGGMGPMATVDFMSKVVAATPASRDQEHIESIVCSASHIPDRTAAIVGDGPDPLPAMEAMLARLVAAGATFIAIPCNTAHHWHAALQARTNVPILHIVDAVIDRLCRKGASAGSIGVLATDGAIRAGVYAKRLHARGYSCATPDEEGQTRVMAAIRLVKAGSIREAAALLRAEAETLLDRGCVQVVMACTEIPVALADESDLSSRLIDATDALATACVEAFSHQVEATEPA